MTRHFRHFDFENALPVEAAFSEFPVLSQEGKHARCSEKYAHISTAQIMRDMDAANFDLIGVTVTRKRDADLQSYAKHMLRWRYRGGNALGEIASFDVIGMNSFDASRAFVFAAGMTVRACLNGCVFGETFERFKIYHTANAVDKVADGVSRILSQGPRVAASVDAMRARMLTDTEQEEFATRAIALRYGDKPAPVSPLALLTARRNADNGTSLWQTFNKTQEHLIRGGLRSVTVGDNGKPKTRSIRAIRGIDENVRLNGALLDLALEYA